MNSFISKNSKYFLLIFLFTIFSGALRKWFIVDNNSKNILFLIQMIIPFIYFITNSIQINKTFSNQWLGVYLFFLIMCAINPLNLTIYHGIIGILIYFSFWFLVVYYLENRNYFDFYKLLYPILGIVFFEFILGSIQYQLPFGHFLNSYADLEKVGGNIAVVGSSVRVTGTFSYISGFTSFMVFFNFFLWTLIKYNFKPFIIIGLILFGFYANLISGSRGANYGYILFLAILFISETKIRNVKFIFRLIPPIVIAALFFLGMNTEVIERSIDLALANFLQRSNFGLETGETQFRILWDILALINFSGNYPVFGVGLGATYQGAVSIFGISQYVLDYGYVEGEMLRIVLEGGFVLLIFRFIFAYFLVKRLLFPPILKAFIFFQIVYQYQTVFNVYNAVFFALGIIILDSAYYKTTPLLTPNTKFAHL